MQQLCTLQTTIRLKNWLNNKYWGVLFKSACLYEVDIKSQYCSQFRIWKSNLWFSYISINPCSSTLCIVWSALICRWCSYRFNSTKPTSILKILPEFRVETMLFRHNAVNFLPNPHKRFPIAHPWGRGVGCLLWVQILMYALSPLLQCCV